MPKVQSPLVLATVHVCCESYKVSSMHCQNAWKLGGRNGFKLKSEALQTSNCSNQNKTNSFCVILNSQNESPHGPNKIQAKQQNALCCHCCDLSNGCVGGKWFTQKFWWFSKTQCAHDRTVAKAVEGGMISCKNIPNFPQKLFSSKGPGGPCGWSMCQQISVSLQKQLRCPEAESVGHPGHLSLWIC